VIIYLKASNYGLKAKLATCGAADQVMVAAVFREHMPLRLEFSRAKIGDVKDKMFDKTQVSGLSYLWSVLVSGQWSVV